MFVKWDDLPTQKSENANGRTGNWRRYDPRKGSAIVGIAEEYQRRTQKGMGRAEKTGHTGAAKNPRLVKACNITKQCDMGEFFFISVSDEICD
jgi:hypothetical protein